MKIAENILWVILIFLSGGVLGYSISNYHHTREEINNDLFIIVMSYERV